MNQGRPEWFLWKKRYRYELSQKKRTLGLVIDWVVALYFIVPSLVIGAVFYVQGITSPPIWWNESIIPFLLTVPMLIPVIFNVRPLFSLGDEGILIASPLSPRRFLIYRWVEDIVAKSIITLILWALIAPYLRVLHYSYVQITTLTVLFFIMSIFIVQNEWFWIGRNRWYHKLGLLIHMILIVLCWNWLINSVFANRFLIVFLFTALILIAGLFLFRRNLKYSWPWSVLIQESVAKRIGIIDFVLGGEQANQKILLKKRRPAHLLRGGLGLKFRPHNALLLLYLKGFLRTKDRYFVYLQAMIYILLATIIVQFWWISAIILGVGLFMLGNVLFAPMIYSDHPWLIIYPFNFEQRNKGLAKGAFLLNALVGLLGSIAVTLHIGIWYYYFPIAIVALAVAWGCVEMARLSRSNMKESSGLMSKRY